MHITEAIILGLIQGITELLPISSSGHLFLAEFFNKQLNLGLNFSFQTTEFDIILHMATFIAIIIAFWPIIKRLVTDWRSAETKKLLINLILTSIPSWIIGLVLLKTGDDFLKQPGLTAAMLIVVGIVLIVVDKNQKLQQQTKEYKSLSFKDAIKIGLFQSLAALRGTSRSGITFIGGQTAGGLSRQSALDYAFLSSLPIFASLAIIETAQLFMDGQQNLFAKNGLELAIGFITALIFGLLSIRVLRSIVKKPGVLSAFGIYRIFLGALVIALLLT